MTVFKKCDDARIAINDQSDGEFSLKRMGGSNFVPSNVQTQTIHVQ